mmetsp:Transcript_25948/g.48384  ORF Transcript_25948/g.48384 Transcript_25948/m.48384 type:complete len:92 (-) Transcript_25948:33-308(-)
MRITMYWAWLCQLNIDSMPSHIVYLNVKATLHGLCCAEPHETVHFAVAMVALRIMHVGDIPKEREILVEIFLVNRRGSWNLSHKDPILTLK